MRKQLFFEKPIISQHSHHKIIKVIVNKNHISYLNVCFMSGLRNCQHKMFVILNTDVDTCTRNVVVFVYAIHSTVHLKCKVFKTSFCYIYIKKNELLCICLNLWLHGSCMKIKFNK